MDAEVIPEIKEVPESQGFKSLLQNRTFIIAVVIIAVALLGGIAFLLFFIYTKYFRKKVDKQKKKQKCDHKKEVSVDNKVEKLDSVLDKLKEEDRKEEEQEEKSRIANLVVSTDDVKQVDEDTSYESEQLSEGLSEAHMH